ncbi:hypothetical protein RhiirC2_863699 [Rhizophagus irregularis]|uniref:Serine-threonine/tyrosine-protein kinase catalytic domain-containing protein n=1 Tax=Rhizophagus irregularis TaxID=588596 RepID=A0A2N1NLB7_9GLOM|nr:hypothetical protein RhiirC2_863699 [Rhizophagus irregularis]
MSQTNETFEEFFSRLNGVNGNSISSASEFMGNVNEAVGPFIPFIAIIATLTREIVKAYDIIKVLVEYCERIKEIFQEIIREFDSCSADLNLAVTTNTNEQMTKDLEILHSDMIEMKKFLDNVGGEPNSILNRNYKKNKSVDIYSLGTLLWEIMSEKIPFSEDQNDGILQLMLRIKEGYREVDIISDPEYVNLYKSCWDGNNLIRPKIDDVYNQLLNITNY